MSQIDDLSAGDSTPKLASASLKSLTLVVNRMAYAFRTPDGAVSPDALQLAQDGNLSLGGVPLLFANVGRNFLVQDNAVATLSVSSTTGNAVVSAQTGSSSGAYTALELRQPDGSAYFRLRYSPNQNCVKLDIKNGVGAPVPFMRFNPTGEVSIGDTTSIIAKLQVLSGTAVSNGAENALFLQSSTPTTVPVMISGTNGGSIQIAGGNNLSGGGRGGQIDFNSATWSAAPGTLVFRTGLGTDGGAQPEVGRWLTSGWLGIGTSAAQSMLHVRAPQGTRSRIISESVNDVGGFTSRRVNGSYASPTPIANNDLIGYWSSHGASDTAGNFLVGATIQMIATENWTSTAAGSGILLSTVANGTMPTINALWLNHNGNAGFNTKTPTAKLVVAYAEGANGYEIDPGANLTILRSFDRNGAVYKTISTYASDYVWSVGASVSNQVMYLGANGTLALNTGTLSGGSGNQAISTRVLIKEAANATALTIAGGTEYAGMKIKVGTLHATSGGANYYDITTRPGDSSNGVGSSPDMPVIRLEASGSMTPRVLLQPSGGTQQVVIGAGVTSATSKLMIEAEAAWESPHILTVGKVVTGTTNPNADIVIRRAGSVSSGAGKMPWIQFESTDSAFAGNNAGAIGSAANSVQIWNYVSNAWVSNFTVAPTGITLNQPALINGGVTIRGPSSGTGNIVLQSNGALGVAHWISSKTSGYLHVGGNGAAEPTVGAITIASSGKSIGLWPLNETQTSYSYSHGGTVAGLHINNTDTAANAQAHLFLASGQTNNAGSAVGTVSWVLPNIASNGTARIVNIGAETDTSHTAAQAAGRFVVSTKSATDATAVPRVRVRASGNVIIGNGFIDAARLYIYNEGRNVDGVRMDFSDMSNVASSFVSQRFDTAGYAMSFLVGGSVAGSITHPSSTSTAYGTSSDRRIKKNIEMAPSAGEIIDRIRVVSHDFIADDYHVPYGFIAQELKEVYAPAVVVGDDSFDVGPQSRIWQVDNSKLVPLLVKEVQDLRTDNAQMKKDLADLREIVNMLLGDKTK